METGEKIVKINCLLHGEIAERFTKIKELKGLANNTEVIRLLISEFYAAFLKGNS